MIVITGGAGFIGSALLWGLNKQSIDDVLVVDNLASTEKWKNLLGLKFNDYMNKDEFIRKLINNEFKNIEAILHLGACSSTTESNAEYLIENNFHYTVKIAKWQEANPKCRLIYASSAATYGDGAEGYSDDESKLDRLRPLNMYGYSKHLFDLYAKKNGWLKNIVGLKYFNVFGPNEYHKQSMSSVIYKAYPGVRDLGEITLFKSYNEKYGDGDQLRDFIYVKDVVNATLAFLGSNANGIFNVGTGIARSWNDVANAMFMSASRKLNIKYIPMPEILKNKYQYYTCADMRKLEQIGLKIECYSLENAIDDYIKNYLVNSSTLSI